MSESETTLGSERFYADSGAGVEWSTPGWIWRPLANALGGFDVDTASGAEGEPIADDQFTEADNGLALPWYGDVWCNYPYGRDENEVWGKKIASEACREEVRTITALVPAAVGADWYQDNHGTADIETFINGRVRFGGSDTDPSFYSAIISYGDFPPEYIEALHSMGQVRPIPDEPTEQATLDSLADSYSQG